MTTPPIISCSDLSMRFQDGELTVDVLEHINFSVAAGQTVAIVGSSGSGKTTLLHLLGGLDTPTTGEVHIAGDVLNTSTEKQRALIRNKYLGFVYQFHHLLPEFTALENVAMPLLIRGQRLKEAVEPAALFLERVGLKARLQHKPAELSGGERQRVAIARALVTQPKCILADEPTGNLDGQTAERVVDLLLTLNQESDTSLVLVTHDQRIAQKMEKQWTIEKGQLIAFDYASE